MKLREGGIEGLYGLPKDELGKNPYPLGQKVLKRRGTESIFCLIAKRLVGRLGGPLSDALSARK